jgi:hypothetical protein
MCHIEGSAAQWISSSRIPIHHIVRVIHQFIHIYFATPMTPYPILAPAFPVGCVLKSSSF